MSPEIAKRLLAKINVTPHGRLERAWERVRREDVDARHARGFLSKPDARIWGGAALPPAKPELDGDTAVAMQMLFAPSGERLDDNGGRCRPAPPGPDESNGHDVRVRLAEKYIAPRGQGLGSAAAVARDLLNGSDGDDENSGFHIETFSSPEADRTKGATRPALIQDRLEEAAGHPIADLRAVLRRKGRLPESMRPMWGALASAV